MIVNSTEDKDGTTWIFYSRKKVFRTTFDDYNDFCNDDEDDDDDIQNWQRLKE